MTKIVLVDKNDNVYDFLWFSNADMKKNNIKSYSINMDLINSINRYYHSLRSKFFLDYTEMTCNFYQLYALCITFTDKYMEKNKVNDYDFNLSVAIYLIVMGFYSDDIENIDEIIEGFSDDELNKHIVIGHIKNFFKSVDFDLQFKTLMTFDELFDNSHQSIKFFYRRLAHDVIRNYKNVQYDCNELFYNILIYMINFVHIDNNNKITYYKTELNYLIDKFKTKNIIQLKLNYNTIIVDDGKIKKQN